LAHDEVRCEAGVCGESEGGGCRYSIVEDE